MVINSQLLTIESLKQSKQTSRTGTESWIRRLIGGLSVGRWKGSMGEKVQRLRSIIGRYRIGRGMLRTE